MRKGGKTVRYKLIKSKLYLNNKQRTFLIMLMHTAKNLYNEALYNVRQHYFETNKSLDKQGIDLDVRESLKLEIETPRWITNKQIKEITIKPKYDGKYIEAIHTYIDKDELILQDSFSGKRSKRGLYQSKDKILINADLNAALNIIRKGNPEAKRIGTRGWNTPKRTYLFSE